MQAFKGCIIGPSLTSPSRERCRGCSDSWTACQKSLTLGSFECLSSFPKMLRETCIRMSLLFSSVQAPPPPLTVLGQPNLGFNSNKLLYLQRRNAHEFPLISYEPQN